jgi:hypothetical protein
MNVAAYQGFRRQAVPAQVAQQLQTVTLPAPTRGLILNENESFMQPGGALQLDNWMPTMKGIRLRGGTKTWAQLPETTPVISMFNYISGSQYRMFAGNATKLYDVTASTPVLVKSGQTSGNYVASQLSNQGGDWMLVLNDAGDAPMRFNGTTWTSLATTTPTNWANSSVYAVGNRALDTTDFSFWKCLVAHTSAATGTFNADRTLHPTYWASDIPADGGSWIVGPPGSSVVTGHNLVYVWKYRGRYFFVEGGTMNAWYLPTNSSGGVLSLIPLSGAATKGGKLLCGFTWSIDAGDGIDDKCVFMTDQGELLIFTGSDPSTIANWRQEGRYATSVPLGMNCHTAIGGDVMIATVDGIIPISASITKDTAQLELAAITRAIKPTWRDEVNAKRALPWTMLKWDEFGGAFVTFPGGIPGSYTMGAVNIATGAWCRYTGLDVMCFGRLRADAFFGTQAGKIIQFERTGTDDGTPYTAIMVGGWEMFSSQSATIVWRQARASFRARAGEPFQPQLSATTDYVIVIPPPPSAAPDPGPLDVWDQGLWGPDAGPTPPGPTPPSPADKLQYAQWDQPAPATATVRNTMWVSIGYTGFSHAPICQVTIAQQALPDVELISIAATYDAAGVNV